MGIDTSSSQSGDTQPDHPEHTTAQQTESIERRSQPPAETRTRGEFARAVQDKPENRSREDPPRERTQDTGQSRPHDGSAVGRHDVRTGERSGPPSGNCAPRDTPRDSHPDDRHRTEATDRSPLENGAPETRDGAAPREERSADGPGSRADVGNRNGNSAGQQDTGILDGLTPESAEHKQESNIVRGADADSRPAEGQAERLATSHEDRSPDQDPSSLDDPNQRSASDRGTDSRAHPSPDDPPGRADAAPRGVDGSSDQLNQNDHGIPDRPARTEQNDGERNQPGETRASSEESAHRPERVIQLRPPVDEHGQDTGSGRLAWTEWNAPRKSPWDDRSLTLQGPSEAAFEGSRDGSKEAQPDPQPEKTSTVYLDGHEIEVTDRADDGIWVEGLPGEPPDKVGDVLASKHESKSTRADRLFRKAFEKSDDLLDSVEKNVDLGAQAMRPPEHTATEVRTAPYTPEAHHHQPDAGSLATAGLALGIMLWETGQIMRKHREGGDHARHR